MMRCFALVCFLLHVFFVWSLELVLALFSVECVQSPAAFFANQLQKAMDGAGTDDERLIRIIVSRSEIDLATIKDEFERIYNKTLYSALSVSLVFVW